MVSSQITSTDSGTSASIYPERSFLLLWVYALLLGTFGFDRFYLGRVPTGLLKFLTMGGLGLWTFIDLIIVLAGGARDRYGRAPTGYEKYKTFAWTVSLTLIIGMFLLVYWQAYNLSISERA